MVQNCTNFKVSDTNLNTRHILFDYLVSYTENFLYVRDISCPIIGEVYLET